LGKPKTFRTAELGVVHPPINQENKHTANVSDNISQISVLILEIPLDYSPKTNPPSGRLALITKNFYSLVPLPKSRFLNFYYVDKSGYCAGAH
jgi:hypothetical protein